MLICQAQLHSTVEQEINPSGVSWAECIIPVISNMKQQAKAQCLTWLSASYF